MHIHTDKLCNAKESHESQVSIKIILDCSRNYLFLVPARGVPLRRLHFLAHQIQLVLDYVYEYLEIDVVTVHLDHFSLFVGLDPLLDLKKFVALQSRYSSPQHLSVEFQEL